MINKSEKNVNFLKQKIYKSVNAIIFNKSKYMFDEVFNQFEERIRQIEEAIFKPKNAGEGNMLSIAQIIERYRISRPTIIKKEKQGILKKVEGSKPRLFYEDDIKSLAASIHPSYKK
jgi:hypothetical protein